MFLGIPITLVGLYCTITAALLLIGIFHLLFSYWPSLPERIPIHFGFNGKPDNWGTKRSSLILPMISFSFFGLLVWVGYFAPLTSSQDLERPFLQLIMGIMNAEVMLLFLWIEWRMFRIALNKVEGMGRWFLPVTLAVLFITIFLLVKATPHFTS
ncbi:MAG: DUF1648 domain-containing protein [Armatimonadota bacterium]